MWIEEARLYDIKSFKDSGVVQLDQGINIFVGRNNVGKTAFLETLYLTRFNAFYGGGHDRILKLGRVSGSPHLHMVLHRDTNSDYVTLPGTIIRFPLDVVRVTVAPANNQFYISKVERKVAANNDWDLVLNVTRDSAGAFSIHVNPALEVPQPNHELDFLNALSSELNTAVFYIGPHRTPPAYTGFEYTEILRTDATNLHQVLHTLNNNRPKVFAQIVSFIKEVFDEVETVLTKNLQTGGTAIHIQLRGSQVEVPLSECGTGLEQLLIVACLVFTNQAPVVLIWDEPHAFLHPAAEKALVRLMQDHSLHQYLISTHSPTLINAVNPEHIHLVSQSQGQATVSKLSLDHQNLKAIFRELGATNTDIFLSSRLCVVEGPSDGPILRQLLPKLDFDCSGLAFPELEGGDKLVSDKWRPRILKMYGELIQRLSSLPIPYLFLLDKNITNNREADSLKQYRGTIKFLERDEIENYLLEPAAVTMAIQEKAARYDVTLPDDFSAAWVSQQLQQAQGKKGSAVLIAIYDKFHLNYDKRRDGPVIASHITFVDAQAKEELRRTFSTLFT